VAYIEVVDTSRDTLTAERAQCACSGAGQRLKRHRAAHQALGGGWSNQELSPALRPSKINCGQ